jgi:hypothetical protein
MDGALNVTCADGTHIRNVSSSHSTWDPNTLAGTVQSTYNMPACGVPSGVPADQHPPTQAGNPDPYGRARLGSRTVCQHNLVCVRVADYNGVAATITVSGKIARIEGQGLKRLQSGQTDSSERVAPLPGFAITVLTERRRRAFWGQQAMIFPSSAPGATRTT